ncbi:MULTISPECIES: carbohydrate kinase [Actinoplanes]|uniref:carbohydrate kinase family protein n=1 Tax=Actinoplanes TaxID=1865 RepID=UPI0005F2AFF5|nr:MULTISPECIES: carbohydrate kinase [Actinoplanes]GLY02061.1 aminoimidazole riboside kinase [Actinoplanes sp. NBRC 101535]
MGYAMVMGEALIDLLEADLDGERIYRQAIGGAPLNVAVGVARLGGRVTYAGTLSGDILGDRLADFLHEAGVGGDGIRRVPVPTTLAVTTFEGAEPSFTFYGEPPSYAQLTPADLDPSTIAGAAVLYTGSICLLREPFRSAARQAWAVPGPIRVFDPNVRPTLLPGAAAVAELRDLVEEFAATADLVKLSAADAAVLYGDTDPVERLGARAVVVTRGADGARVTAFGESIDLPAPAVAAIDATGAGDSVMAALISRLLEHGRPAGADDWREHVAFALSVAGLVCERPGGATAMPTAAELAARWG